MRHRMRRDSKFASGLVFEGEERLSRSFFLWIIVSLVLLVSLGRIVYSSSRKLHLLIISTFMMDRNNSVVS